MQSLREEVSTFISEILKEVDKKDPATISAVAELLKAYSIVCDHLL